MAQVTPWEAALASKAALFRRMAFLIRDAPGLRTDRLCGLSFRSRCTNAVRTSVCYSVLQAHRGNGDGNQMVVTVGD